MKPAILAGLASIPVAGYAVDAVSFLTKAFAGPKTPYSCEQSSLLAGDSGMVRSKVKVFGDGKGGERREYVLSSGDRVVWLQLRGGAWQFDGSRWIRLPESPAMSAAQVARLVIQNYVVEMGAPSTLLGRKAILVKLKPRRDFCPSRELWVDTFTGLVLKDKLLAPDGRLRSSTSTLSVRFGPQAAGQFAKPTRFSEVERFGPASFTSVGSKAKAESLTGRSVPEPGHVPAGFRPVAYGVMTTAGAARKMPAVRYSDGLASFTIFERGQGRNRRGRGWQGGRNQGGSEGLVSDVQRAVVEVRGRRNYILIGDVSESELRKVAGSLN